MPAPGIHYHPGVLIVNPRLMATFTAQVTDLLYTESMLNLEYLTSTVFPWYRLRATDKPLTKLQQNIWSILSRVRVSQNNIFLGMMFIHRLRVRIGESLTETGGLVFIVALALADKTLHDYPYPNTAWAKVAGSTVQNFNHVEMTFLWNIDMGVSEKEWQDWQIQLMRLWCYEATASLVPNILQYPKPALRTHIRPRRKVKPIVVTPGSICKPLAIARRRPLGHWDKSMMQRAEALTR